MQRTTLFAKATKMKLLGAEAARALEDQIVYQILDMF